MDGLRNLHSITEMPRRIGTKDDRDDVDFLKLHQDQTLLLDSIKACAKQKNLHTGSRLHAHALENGLLTKNTSLGNALLTMYAKCGALSKAQEMFDELPARNVVTWNALIAAYTQHGFGDEALIWFERMKCEGFSPSAITYICVLKACGSMGAAKKGEEIHVEVSRQGLLEKDVMLGTSLVDMYAKCGVLAKAQGVFENLPVRNVVSWNALIGGYAQHGLGYEALSCFERMRDEGVSPDAVSYICILKACGSIRAAEKGEAIHAEVSKQGLLEKNIVLGNAVVDMYAKCGMLAKAQGVFDKLPEHDVATWTALINGYAHHGLGEEALSCFGRMQDEGLSPNAITFICVLNACASIGAAKEGEEIHGKIRRQGLLRKDIVLGNALVNMYAKCGVPLKAQEVFDELPARDIATWTALIAGYAQQGLGDEALSCFERMQDVGISPDVVTFVCVLQACSSIGAAEKGEEVHTKVHRQGLLKKHIVLGNALVDMYVKCGELAKAQEVFDKVRARDVSTWTALMAGYAQVGKVRTVIDLFMKMTEEDIKPNAVTFVVLLTACSHAGLVKEGQMFFDAMSTVYCFIPTSEHHTCMVDMFIRAGHFDKAINMIERVPPPDCFLLWSALVGKWVNIELGRWAFEHAVQWDEKFAAAYIFMSNIYAAADMRKEVNDMEAENKIRSMEV